MSWEPGVPLFSRGNYSNYLFNFRADPAEREDGSCNCGDAAHWPDPLPSHRLPDDEDFERVFARTREAS